MREMVEDALTGERSEADRRVPVMRDAKALREESRRSPQTKRPRTARHVEQDCAARPAVLEPNGQTVGLAVYGLVGDTAFERMVQAEVTLKTLGYCVDWVGDPVAVAKRLVGGARWSFIYVVGDGELWSSTRWHLLALGDMFDQRIVEAGFDTRELHQNDAPLPLTRSLPRASEPSRIRPILY